MTLRRQLHRALFALPLLGVGFLASQVPPPAVGEIVETIVAAGLPCERDAAAPGPLSLARVPGDLGLLTRRMSCQTEAA